MLNFIGSLLGKIADRVLPDRAKINEAQSRINETEVGGAPASILRLWRSFLGWVLALIFAWEIVGRSIIATYFPDVTLPPSVLKEITSLLMAMMGMGW